MQRRAGPPPSRGNRRWEQFGAELDARFEGRGGGRGRRRMFAGDELRLVLLKLIEEAPRHGYDLIREIEERTGGAYAPSPGVVYPTLTMLADMGLIGEQPSDDAKKVFAVTPAGTAHLTERAEEVAGIMARLSSLGAETDRVAWQRTPVRRAMGNLRQAIQDRIPRDVADEATLHAITDILDEAARKIERL